MTRGTIVGVGTWALLAMACLTALSAPAARAQAPPTKQEIFKRLGVDVEPADYVVLIDRSDSMAADGLYSRVRTTLARFLAGTTRQDHVVVYTFSSFSVLRYEGPGGLPAAILDRIPTKTFDGQTDIGKAIDTAVDALGRPEHAQVASVVMLTDGNHHPLASSKYTPDTDGPAWRVLAKQAEALASDGRTMVGYALPLRNEANGAKLLSQVVPDTTVVDPSDVPDIGGFLDRAQQSIHVEKAKRLLAGDIGRGVVVHWPPNKKIDAQRRPADITVTLRSRLHHAPVTVSNLVLRVAGPSSSVASLAPHTPTRIDLEPGQSTTVVVRLRWAPGAGLLPYKRTKTLEPKLTLDADVSSRWAAALAPAIDLDIASAPTNGTRAIQLEATVGKGWFLPLAAVLIILLIIAIRVGWYFRSNPRVQGTLYLQRLDTEDRQSIRLGRGRSTFLFESSNGGPTGEGTVRPIRAAHGAKALEITYTPDGDPARQSREEMLLPDGHATLAGVRFTSTVDGAAPPRATGSRRRTTDLR